MNVDGKARTFQIPRTAHTSQVGSLHMQTRSLEAFPKSIGDNMLLIPRHSQVGSSIIAILEHESIQYMLCGFVVSLNSCVRNPSNRIKSRPTTYPQIHTRYSQVEPSPNIAWVEFQSPIIILKCVLRLTAIRHRGADPIVQKPVLNTKHKCVRMVCFKG